MAFPFLSGPESDTAVVRNIHDTNVVVDTSCIALKFKQFAIFCDFGATID